MNRLRARLFASRDDLLDLEIRFRGWWRPDMHGLVGHLDMQRVFVSIRINGDGLDAHLTGGLDDPAGDFAAIGNQNFVEHVTPWPLLTGLIGNAFKAFWRARKPC
jgi:hypothetical protein